MKLDIGSYKPRRIAVIGAGISGMGAAYLLSEANEVVLFGPSSPDKMIPKPRATRLCHRLNGLSPYLGVRFVTHSQQFLFSRDIAQECECNGCPKTQFSIGRRQE